MDDGEQNNRQAKVVHEGIQQSEEVKDRVDEDGVEHARGWLRRSFRW